MSIKDNIIKYAMENLKTKPDTPWMKYPDNIVLRHNGSRKWYALIMKIQTDKLGIEGNSTADIINVKCDPILVNSLVKNDGYFPAYHMNKTHWITIILDGTVKEKEILNFLNMSFDRTK